MSRQLDLETQAPQAGSESLRSIPTLFRIPDMSLVETKDHGSPPSPSIAAPKRPDSFSANDLDSSDAGETDASDQKTRESTLATDEGKSYRYDLPVGSSDDADKKSGTIDRRKRNAVWINRALAAAFVCGAVCTALFLIMGRGGSDPSDSGSLALPPDVDTALDVPSISLGNDSDEGDPSASSEARTASHDVDLGEPPSSTIVGLTGDSSDGDSSSPPQALTSDDGNVPPPLMATNEGASYERPVEEAGRRTASPTTYPTRDPRLDSYTAPGATQANRGARPGMPSGGAPTVGNTSPLYQDPAAFDHATSPDNSTRHAGPPANYSAPGMENPAPGMENPVHGQPSLYDDPRASSFQSPHATHTSTYGAPRPDARHGVVGPVTPEMPRNDARTRYPQTDPQRYPAFAPPRPAAEIGRRPTTQYESTSPYDRGASYNGQAPYNGQPSSGYGTSDGAARLQGTIQPPAFRAQYEPYRKNVY